MQYLELESEKYLCQKLDRQLAEAKRYRNRKAVRDFVTFVIGIALVPAAMLLAYQLPFWFPGIASTLESWMQQALPTQIADMMTQVAS